MPTVRPSFRRARSTGAGSTPFTTAPSHWPVALLLVALMAITFALPGAAAFGIEIASAQEPGQDLLDDPAVQQASGLQLDSTAEELRASGSNFTAHRFPHPEGPMELEEWAAKNFADDLIAGSLEDLQMGEFAVLAFLSRSESDTAGTEMNVLIDTGDALVLLTTAQLSAPWPALDVPAPDGEVDKASCATSTNACNCVLYARCRVPTLPYGLFTYDDKLAIKNASSPTVGSVAIMKTGLPYGHLGVVTAVKRNGFGTVTSITISEANYSPCRIGSRRGLPSALKVTGYFKP